MPKSNRKQTITLAMIVKNEADVIERCLKSVAPFVDNILIHDTGSSDDTKGIIERYIKKNNLHGFVQSVDWVDFGYNRSHVLERARNTADYTFMLDADEMLVGNGGDIRDTFATLTADTYQMDVYLGNIKFKRNFLFKNTRNWYYMDPIHEYAHVDGDYTSDDAEHIHILSTYDGARSKDPDKYLKDAQVLVNYDKTETTPRRTFYTAQSFKDAGNLEEAVKYYKKRIDMEHGWWQERYFSYYMVGRLTRDPKALLEAYLLEPLRAEPLVVLGKLLMDDRNWHAANLFLSKAYKLKYAPEGSLFVETDVYDWRAGLEYAVCLYYLEEYEAAQNINEKLLGNVKLPEGQRELVSRNLVFCKSKIDEEEKCTNE